MDMQWILVPLVVQFPILIACSAGIVWALLRIDQQTRPALLVVAGLDLYVVLGIAQVFAQGPLQQVMSRMFAQDGAMIGPQYSFAIVGFAFNAVRAISLGLLVLAAFVDRPVVVMRVPQQPVR